MPLIALLGFAARRICAAYLFFFLAFSLLAGSATAYSRIDSQPAQATGAPSANKAAADKAAADKATADKAAADKAASDKAASDKAAADKAVADKAAADKPAASPKITSAVLFPQAVSQTSSPSTTQDFILEISGTDLDKITDINKAYIAVLPATGVAPTQIPVFYSLDKSKILTQFTGPTNYSLEGVTLWTGSALLPLSTGALSCEFKSKVTLTPQVVPKDQAGNKYGNGVAKNFYAIQVSIVNECPMAVVVPLAGMRVIVDTGIFPNGQNPDTNKDDVCTEKGDLVAFSLDHVTSIFSTDRKLTGRRAIYFNTVQALATIGSAIEPFLAKGFTQGVAILGGGFTTASKEVLVDMSAEQLQNLTSQSFGATEQVASHGSLQKFIFVRRSTYKKCQNTLTERALRHGEFAVLWEMSPASAAAPTTQTAPAQASQKGTAPTSTTGGAPPTTPPPQTSPK